MSGFQDNLNEELEKRRETSVAPPLDKSQTKASKFSFKSFFAGLVLCGLLSTALAGWAKINAPKTLLGLQEKLPSKTAIVEVAEGDEIENTLTIPRTRKEELAQPSNQAPSESNETVATIDDIKPLNAVRPQDTLAPSTPSITEDKKPYLSHKNAFVKQTNKPLLSIIITDMGLSKNKTNQIIKDFPDEVGLSFSPYTKDLKELANTARNDGHEIWLTLPLETKEYPLNDPGPSTLLINTSTEKNQVRLKNVMDAANNYVGFVSPYNHIFKAEDANVNPFIKEIFKQGYAVIDGNNSSRSFVGGIADRNKYPYTQNDIWLDNDLAPLSLNQNIRQITEYGENKRNVVVMLRPYPASLKSLQKFLDSKLANNFELAPASAQLKNK